MSPSRFVVGMVALGMIVLGAGVVSGQVYPSKPIRLIASGLGGGSDFTARLIGQGISGPLGQPVVVENRAAITQGETVSKAPPDGYTLLVAGSNVWITPLLQKKTPYDPVTDFSVITLTDISPNILVVHPSMPVKSVKELVALAKAKPGELNYGSVSIGGSVHLATELFKSMAGVNIVHIPYRSTALAFTDLIAGQLQMMFSSAVSVMPQVKSGKLRALAVTSAAPSVLAPGLPTVAASGLPGYEAIGITGAYAPAKTPVAIINRLNQEIVRFLNTAEAKEQFLNTGGQVAGNSPEQSTAILKADIARWSKVIKDAGIRSE